MSELRFTPTPETFGSRTEAPLLTSETELDLHTSDLPSAEIGREFALAARRAIDEKLAREQPPMPKPHEVIAEVSKHLVDFRRWEEGMHQGEGAEAFQQAEAAFNQRPSNVSDTDTFGYELTNSRR